jgi:hypothetical protein
MSTNSSGIFYIVLCLEIALLLVLGLLLVLLPWIPQGTLGLSDWGNNYFLLYVARKTGLHALQTVVASGWIRGAVTGLGLLNISIAFWEIFHFSQTVQSLRESTETRPARNNAVRPAKPASSAYLPHHERTDDRADNTGQ